jgi:hypothetical protein
MEAIGVNGKVVVDDVFVTISREGSTKLNKLASRMQQGYKGEKRIAIAQISAVQFKAVGAFGAWNDKINNAIPGIRALNKATGSQAGATGYIEFVVIGSSESKGGLSSMASNENAVTFGLSHEQSFTEIREFVETKIRERYTNQPAPVAATAAPIDVVSQLTSLKQLLDSGVLSEEEFQKSKAKILGI